MVVVFKIKNEGKEENPNLPENYNLVKDGTSKAKREVKSLNQYLHQGLVTIEGLWRLPLCFRIENLGY